MSRRRVLLLCRYDRQGASSRLRSYQYLPYLEEHGIDVDVSPLLDREYLLSLYAGGTALRSILRGHIRRLNSLLRSRSYDLVWIEKEALPWVPAFVEIALLRNACVLADYDDAIFHKYDSHRSRLVRRLLGQKIDQVMARADGILVGSQYLAGRASSAGASRIEKLPTVVDLQRYPAPRYDSAPGDAPIKIGWIGSPWTAKYLNELIPVFHDLSRRFRIQIVVIGARISDPLLEASGVLSYRPWSEDSEVSEIDAVDVGIMPLPDEPFERGKCGYKLIQYMACGKPVVASPVGENKIIVQEAITGYLASNETEWLQALSSLCADAGLRVALGRAGRAAIEQSYSLRSTAPRLLDFMQTLISTHRIHESP